MSTYLSDYDYFLPEELIGQKPREPRDSAKLMLIDRKSGSVEHKNFYNIIDYLQKGDVLVRNATKVIPARIFGHKDTGGVLEILLIKRITLDTWECLLKPAKKLKLGQKLILASNKPNMIYEGAVVCESFENDNFYYTSSIINCIYDCEYCYLQGVYSSGNIVIFVDVEKVFEEVEELYNKLKTLYLCVSYDTDLLAIESICAFSEKWYYFIKDKKDLKIELRTKSGNIDKFLNLKPLDNFIIAFTLSPENIALRNEKYTASFKNRVKAIKELQEKGWKVRICIDPLIYSDNFEKNYSQMIEYLFNEIDKEKVIDISIGVFRISKEYLKKMRNQNQNSEILYYPFECIDGVYTYSDKTKSYMINFIKEQFLDFSGYEFSTNKIYIEDYVSKNIKEESFCFINAFKVKWNKVFPGKPCVLFLYFKSNEYGFSSVFSFHVKRIDEYVLDISSIEDFEDEIYVEILN